MKMARLEAFTLIELLVVIAVIGLLAALVIPLSGIATAKMRIARVTGELNNYVTAIETYKLEVGQYPPDHGLLKETDFASNPEQWRTNAAHSPLFFELTGATFTNTSPNSGYFRLAGSGETINATDLQNYFGRNGIRNSARHRGDIPYKGFGLRESQYRELDVGGPNARMGVLAVPVPGPMMLTGRLPGNPSVKTRFNPWFYDSSTTNRHNPKSFDLWAEILIGGKTNIIGNWKE